MQIFRYTSLDSSQNEAKRLIDKGGLELPAAIITEEQSAGRGQYGKSWASPRGAGLYATIMVRSSKLETQNPKQLTLDIAEQVLKTLQDLYPADYYIKPINDIYYNDCKLAGILVELYKEHLLIGIGLNLKQMPRQIKEACVESPKAPPISLEEIVSAEFNEEEFLNRFITLTCSN